MLRLFGRTQLLRPRCFSSLHRASSTAVRFLDQRRTAFTEAGGDSNRKKETQSLFNSIFEAEMKPKEETASTSMESIFSSIFGSKKGGKSLHELKYMHLYPKKGREWVVDAKTPLGYYNQAGYWVATEQFKNLLFTEQKKEAIDFLGEDANRKQDMFAKEDAEPAEPVIQHAQETPDSYVSGASEEAAMEALQEEEFQQKMASASQGIMSKSGGGAIVNILLKDKELARQRFADVYVCDGTTLDDIAVPQERDSIFALSRIISKIAAGRDIHGRQTASILTSDLMKALDEFHKVVIQRGSTYSRAITGMSVPEFTDYMLSLKLHFCEEEMLFDNKWSNILAKYEEHRQGGNEVEIVESSEEALQERFNASISELNDFLVTYALDVKMRVDQTSVDDSWYRMMQFIPDEGTQKLLESVNDNPDHVTIVHDMKKLLHPIEEDFTKKELSQLFSEKEVITDELKALKIKDETLLPKSEDVTGFFDFNRVLMLRGINRLRSYLEARFMSNDVDRQKAINKWNKLDTSNYTPSDVRRFLFEQVLCSFDEDANRPEDEKFRQTLLADDTDYTKHRSHVQSQNYFNSVMKNKLSSMVDSNSNVAVLRQHSFYDPIDSSGDAFKHIDSVSEKASVVDLYASYLSMLKFRSVRLQQAAPVSETAKQLFGHRDGTRKMTPPPRRKTIPADLVGQFKWGVTEEMLNDVKADEKVRRVLSFEYSNQRDINQFRIQRAIRKWQREDGDTGSTPVQVAVLSEKIRYLNEHQKKHKKDKHTARGLRQYVQDRKALMKYLRRKDIRAYFELIRHYNLREFS